MLKDSLVATQQGIDGRPNAEADQADALSSGLIDRSPLESNGQCLVTEQGRIKMADEGFRSSLGSVSLTIENDHLMPASADRRTAWLIALAQVRGSGEGQLFVLNQRPKLVSVGIVPQPGGRFVAIHLPRARMCSPACVRSYARLIALTPREASVLDLLIQGHSPATVANELSTRESTVRTQIKSILAKSSHHSIRGLLVTLACLPSMSAVTVNQSATDHSRPASI